MAVDEAKLEEFVGQWIGDMGAAQTMMLVAIGDRLGLYRAMAGAGPLTSEELAERTETPERYIRMWLANHAASGYVTYDPGSSSYTLPDEQAAVFADPSSPVYLVGAAELITSLYQDQDAIVRAYREGTGYAWHEHSPNLFRGVERFFRPGYAAYLPSTWIPALEGVEDKLRGGARVADVGCGHGTSTAVMAKAFPASTFVGFDYHTPSIEEARKLAADEGVADRVRFAVAGAADYPGDEYDLVCLFDCLHDMGDPIGALQHIRSTLADDGTVLLVEPQAGERVEDNLNPVGRVYYASAATICVPSAVSQTGEAPLDTQSSEAAERAVAGEAGFTRFRKATETPVNRIFELKP